MTDRELLELAAKAAVLSEHPAHWDWCPICRGGLDTGLECADCGYDMMPVSDALTKIEPLCTALRAALKQESEPDMRHPKIQGLIAKNARLSISLRLIEDLLENPHMETTSIDMEYWDSLHDRLYAVLIKNMESTPQRVAALEAELERAKEEKAND